MTGRFGTQYGVELMPHPAAAFAANIRNVDGTRPGLYVGDISEFVADQRRMADEFARHGVLPGELDVLAGGPPCQGFSRNGVRKYEDDEKTLRFYDDPRNHLYRDFLKVVELLQPKVVLVENVREFLNFGKGKFSSDLIKKFSELGYSVQYRKVCAADFGVPQVRYRVIFLAVRRDLENAFGRSVSYPDGSFGSEANDLFGPAVKPFRTVRDAISDLPSPGFDKNAPPLLYDKRRKVSEYASELRSATGSVSNHFARKLGALQIRRINNVGTGRMRDIAEDLQTRSFYGSAYRRMEWDAPSLTITTWVYHVGSGAFAHPSEDRGVTMREAARIQSFDDDYVFPNLVNPVSQMIGNAVPPLLAKAYANNIVEFLDHCAGAKIAPDYKGARKNRVRRPLKETA